MEQPLLIDKSTIQSHRQCAKKAWMEVHGTVLPQRSGSAAAVLSEGEVVHDMARKLFREAKRVGTMKLRDAAAETSRLIEAGETSLFEAAFMRGDLGVRADAIVKRGSGWELTEFKSGSSVKDEYLDDCAIQYVAATEAGLRVEKVLLCHPDTSLSMSAEGCGHEVLVTDEVTEAVQARAVRVFGWLQECRATLSGEVPEVAPGKQCTDPYECPFAYHCGKPDEKKIVDDVNHLPSHAGIVKECIASGIRAISELPAAAFSHERNALVRDAIVARCAVIRPEFARTVKRLAYPRVFVDFEAASFAIPRFPGLRAYQAVPFQWSSHRVEFEGQEARHSEFIDVGGGDPRRGFMESLLEATKGAGAVLVYSGYEKARLKELAQAMPDLAAGIEEVISKLVDLLPLARRGYYHPLMFGSWSIKKVLPTLPKKEGVTYEELEGVSDGMQAQAAYIELTNPLIVGEQKGKLKAQLLAYCKVDTAGLLHFAQCVEAAST